MQNMVRSVIDRVFRERDREFFLGCCCRPPALPPALSELLKRPQAPVMEYYTALRCWPCRKWVIQTSTVEKGDFHAKFETHLVISKLAPLFHIHHEFSVRNADEERVTPALGGFSEQAYSLSQFRLEEEACRILTSAGYSRLSFAELAEVVGDLSSPPGVTMFGPQVTVEYALFNDLFGWCGERNAANPPLST